MKNDKHTTAIPEATITQIHGQITVVLQTLAPYTIAFTPHERQTMPKMGDKSLAFVEKTHDYAVDNPTLTPSYLDMASFDVVFADAHGLWSLLTLIRQSWRKPLRTPLWQRGARRFTRPLPFTTTCRLPVATGTGCYLHDSLADAQALPQSHGERGNAGDL
jgi:hypothetical protein